MKELWNKLWLWSWAASSTLFRDFAVEVLGGSDGGGGRKVWGMTALWWELGCGWVMAREGKLIFLHIS